MKTLLTNSRADVRRADETLIAKIDISSIHAEIMKSELGFNSNSLPNLSSTPQIIAAISIDATVMGDDGRDVIIVRGSKSGDRYYYEFQLITMRDIQIDMEPVVFLSGSAQQKLIEVRLMGCFQVDVKITVGSLTESDITSIKDLYHVSGDPSSQSSSPYIKGATSCEFYKNGVLTDVLLPFDSGFYWFGTGTNYLAPFFGGADGPRFGLQVNGSSYYTDKLTSDSAKLNSIIRLHTSVDYIIFK